MTKTALPALSLEAAGQIGHAMISSHWKGRPYQKRYVVPHDPKSQLQVARRARTKFLTNAWATLTAAQKASWETIRKGRELPLYCVFLAHNMPYSNRYYSTWPRADHTGSSATADGHVLSAVGIPRAVQLAWTAPPGQPSWCWVIMRQTSPYVALSLGRHAIAYLRAGADVLSWIDYHSVPGVENRYWIRDCNETGTYSSDGNAANATPLP
jgi:hypothetical protein